MKYINRTKGKGNREGGGGRRGVRGKRVSKEVKEHIEVLSVFLPPMRGKGICGRGDN